MMVFVWRNAVAVLVNAMNSVKVVYIMIIAHLVPMELCSGTGIALMNVMMDTFMMMLVRNVEVVFLSVNIASMQLSVPLVLQDCICTGADASRNAH
jgi:hypothetical protein